MSGGQHPRADHVWSTLQEQQRQEVVNQIRRTLMEIINEHFRISPRQASGTQRGDLRSAVQSESGADQQGESEDAVRVA